jgi:hypothetical protein
MQEHRDIRDAGKLSSIGAFALAVWERGFVKDLSCRSSRWVRLPTSHALISADRGQIQFFFFFLLLTIYAFNVLLFGLVLHLQDTNPTDSA